MIITFGEFKGKLVETVILKEPVHVMWILSQVNAGGPLAHIRKEALRLITVFDSRPFSCKCYGCKSRPATRFSLALPSPTAYWWCDVCSPRSMGCDGLLTVGKTYQDALKYAKNCCLRKDHTKENLLKPKGSHGKWA